MNETTPQGEVSQGITEQEAMQQILGRMTRSEEPEASEEQEEPQEQQTDEVDAAPEEDASADQAEESDESEIDVAGEKFKIPAALAETAKRIEAKAKEVEAGATRKFQEAADLRKSAESQLEAVKQLQRLANVHADILADHKMVAKRLQQLESIDIQNTDSDTLTRLNAEYNQLQAASRRLEQQLTQGNEAMQAEESKAVQAKMAHANEILKTRIKGWGPDMAKSLSEYAINRGAPPEALSGITEAWMVEVLADAAYGRQMREHKSTVEKRVVQTPKTLKPGASGPGKANAQQAEQALGRLRKSGSVSDAAAALLARAGTRKR